MDLAGISLAALLVTILVSCTTRVNPGLLALVFAWLIGVYLAPLWDKAVGMKGVVAGFPTELFLTLVSVTLLFTQAQVNGTLAQVARAAVYACRGNVGLIPVIFFLLAFLLASVLEEFFAKHASLNSFTETALDVVGRGEVMRWPTRFGQRPLV